jgi:predicted lipoprotein with Yx(FWY)xxD motif
MPSSYGPRMTRQIFAALALTLSLAACGGGGSSGYGGTLPTTTPAPTSGALSTATLNGSPGFVNASQRTVYVFDSDTTANQSTCSGQCANIWPPVTVAAGTTLPANWTMFMRADGSQQLAYKGRPLYTYVVDTAPGQTNGDGINSFNGLWHIARP